MPKTGSITVRKILCILSKQNSFYSYNTEPSYWSDFSMNSNLKESFLIKVRNFYLTKNHSTIISNGHRSQYSFNSSDLFNKPIEYFNLLEVVLLMQIVYCVVLHLKITLSETN